MLGAHATGFLVLPVKTVPQELNVVKASLGCTVIVKGSRRVFRVRKCATAGFGAAKYVTLGIVVHQVVEPAKTTLARQL